jgi:hypothetical protein
VNRSRRIVASRSITSPKVTTLTMGSRSFFY